MNDDRRMRVMKAIALELQRQALGDYCHTRDFKTVRFDGTIDLPRLADVIVGNAIEPKYGKYGDGANDSISTLDAAYAARDLLPLLQALKPEARATVLDYLGAKPQ